MVKYLKGPNGVYLIYIDYARKHSIPNAYIGVVIGRKSYYETLYFDEDRSYDEYFNKTIINKLNKIAINTIFTKQIDKIQS